MQRKTVFVIAGMVVGLALITAVISLRHPRPVIKPAIQPPRPLKAVEVSHPSPSSHTSRPAAMHTKHTDAPKQVALKPAKKEPLPSLIPGSPLDDARFAAISAKVVVASVGLKHDSNWQSLVMDYMQQVLRKEHVTVDQYVNYAAALQKNQDRCRAVAANIVSLAQKKVGCHIDLKVLPMFHFDKETRKEVEAKLK